MKKVVTDMMGRTMEINYTPTRIISLVPSQTELLYDLGLEEEVVGITKFCVHPSKWHEEKTIVGGTKKFHLGKILKLEPDLIIANKEENTKSEIETLARHCPVWISDVKTIGDAKLMIKELGTIVNKKAIAENLSTAIAQAFASIAKPGKRLKTAYLIWRKPWMTIGSDTFINDIICSIGWKNVFENKQRYPETNLEELAQLTPELILLSSEPYPFKEKHIAEIQSKIPKAKVLLVDGELFSWYGSRMQKAPSYFNELIKSIQE